MPNRIIRESITTSQSWDALSFAAEAFCTRLITVVDDYGRMDARSSVLRAKCFPLRLSKVSDRMIAGWLGELIEAGMVVVYSGLGGAFLQFKHWAKYQNIRAKESKFPAPPDQLLADDSTCDQLIADVPVIHARLGSRYSDLVTRISGDARPAVRAPIILDEDKAYEHAASKGYNRAEAAELLEAFRDHWESKGWRDKDGPLKDLNSRFRTWVRNAPGFNFPPSGKVHGAPEESRNKWGNTPAEQAEVDAINADVERLRAERRLAAQAS